MRRETLREIGRIGLVVTVLSVATNALHPIGSTEKYADPLAFMAEMSTFWIVLHLAISILILFVPWVFWAWTHTFLDQTARAWGGLGVSTIIIGTAIGVIHLAGVDGMALATLGGVIEEQGSAPELLGAAQALHKLHLGTFTAWLATFWAAAPLFIGIGALRDPAQPRLLGVVLILGSLVAMASIAVMVAEGQLTTLSEGWLLRPATALFTVAIFWVSYRLLRIETDTPAPSAG